MKKYWYLLMLAIIAAMSLTITSCGGDDDDEPEGGGSNNGKWQWQTLTINGTNFYNCIGGIIYSCSNYEIVDGYVYENGHYKEMEIANFNISLYDSKSIEAEGFADVFLSIPASSFSNGRNITSDIIDMSVTVWGDESWCYDESNRNLDVKGGSVKLADIKKDKATLKFSNFKVELEGEIITLNGEATCEEF